MWAGGASRNDGQLTLNNNIAESINVAQLGVDGIYEVRASFEMPDNSSEICLGINLINDTDRGWRACLKATTFNLDFPSGNGTGTTISRRNTGVLQKALPQECNLLMAPVRRFLYKTKDSVMAVVFCFRQRLEM